MNHGHCAEWAGAWVWPESQRSQRQIVRRKMRLTLPQNLYFLEKPWSHGLGSVINMLFAWLLSLLWSALCRNCRREESCPRTRVVQSCLWVTGHRSALRERKREQASLNSESSLSTYRWLAGLLEKPVLRTVWLLEGGQGLRCCQMAYADLWASTGQFLSNFMRAEIF